MKLILSIVMLSIGQILVWFQLYGTDTIPSTWIREHKQIFAYIIALPVAYFYIAATKYGIEYYDGATWPMRIMTFSIGNIIFLFLSLFLLGETLNIKTIICLILSIIVIGIQVIWK